MQSPFFVDDTSLVTYNKDLDTLVNQVYMTFQKLSWWCMVNKLTISVKKRFVLFHTPNKRLVRNLRKITTGNMVIKRVDISEYLGVTIILAI